MHLITNPKLLPTISWWSALYLLILLIDVAESYLKLSMKGQTDFLSTVNIFEIFHQSIATIFGSICLEKYYKIDVNRQNDFFSNLH